MHRRALLALAGGAGLIVCALLITLLSRAIAALPSQSASLQIASSATTTASPARWQGYINGMHTWVTVIPRGHSISDDARANDPWWKWGNTTSDIYLFSFGGFENVRLILAFDLQANGSPKATFYDNTLNKKPLLYTLTGDQLTVQTGGGRPYLVVRPEQGSWLIDGKANYNLQIDRYVATGEARSDQQSDNGPDWVIRVGGAQPGVPDWETQRQVRDPNPQHGDVRFGLTLRLPNAPEFRVTPPVLPDFPYFGIGDGSVDWFTQNPNPLYFNVPGSQLLLYPFPGFETGGSYEVTSLSLPPDVDFEAPFVFYRFAPNTRHAQLVVRAESYPNGDQFGPAPTRQQRSSFRYSWTSTNSESWSYSLHVAGFHPYTQTVQLGDAEIHGVSASELPTWVASKVWPLVTFVEAVHGYRGSEGIYFYSAQGTAPWPYLGGLSTDHPDYLSAPYLPSNDALTVLSGESLPPDFRGEYADDNSRPLGLYLSPVDNRLHLLGAKGGLLNLGDSLVLRVHNLTGGQYVDGWTLERVPAQPAAAAAAQPTPPSGTPAEPESPPRAVPGTVEQALYTLDGYLIYSGPSGARLVKASFQPSIFQALPPTDKASWEDLNRRLAPYIDRERDPRNLAQWLVAFPGESITIDGGQISDVRATASGYQFVLDLQPGFLPSGAELIDLRRLRPGLYVVSYDGHFSIQPLVLSNLSVSAQLPLDHPATTGQPSLIQIRATNTGLEDAAGLDLSVTARQGRHAIQISQRSVDLLGGQPIQEMVSWQPPSAGTWEITARLESSDGNVIAQDSPSVIVANQPDFSDRSVLSLSTGGGWRLPAFLLLIAGSILLWVMPRPSAGRGADRPDDSST